MSHPPNGTVLAPSFLCVSNNAVRLRISVINESIALFGVDLMYFLAFGQYVAHYSKEGIISIIRGKPQRCSAFGEKKFYFTRFFEMIPKKVEK
jgi:hypothetical protein